MASLFGGLFRKAPQISENIPKFAFTIETNPYRCKRTWPPDFSKLSQKHQFRLERRYRRRAKLKWARPNWTKGVRLAQWGSIVFVLIYGVLFMQVATYCWLQKDDHWWTKGVVAWAAVRLLTGKCCCHAS